MTRKAAATATATSSGQHSCLCITSRAEFFSKTSNYPGDSAPLQPRSGALRLLAFPKTKINLKEKRFQTGDEIQENTMGSCWRLGKPCEVPGACFEGDWGVIVLCTMFLVFGSFSINVSIFHITWLDTFWTGLIYLDNRHGWIDVSCYHCKALWEKIQNHILSVENEEGHYLAHRRGNPFVITGWPPYSLLQGPRTRTGSEFGSHKQGRGVRTRTDSCLSRLDCCN